MTTDQERQVADWIATLIDRVYGVAPGPWTARDAKDDSGLTIDFTFDDAPDPIAVEVTRLRDDFERPSEEHMNALVRRLTQFVNAINQPNWSIGIRAETPLQDSIGREIERTIEWVLAGELDVLGPPLAMADISDDLADRMRAGGCGTGSSRTVVERRCPG